MSVSTTRPHSTVLFAIGRAALRKRIVGPEYPESTARRRCARRKRQVMPCSLRCLCPPAQYCGVRPAYDPTPDLHWRCRHLSRYCAGTSRCFRICLMKAAPRPLFYVLASVNGLFVVHIAPDLNRRNVSRCRLALIRSIPAQYSSTARLCTVSRLRACCPRLFAPAP